MGKDVFDTHEEAMQYLRGMGPRLEVGRGPGVEVRRRCRVVVWASGATTQYVGGLRRSPFK